MQLCVSSSAYHKHWDKIVHNKSERIWSNDQKQINLYHLMMTLQQIRGAFGINKPFEINHYFEWNRVMAWASKWATHR